MTENNPYLHQIKNVLPRILALYDSNPISPFHGLGDRFFWAWKLIDLRARIIGWSWNNSRIIIKNMISTTSGMLE